MVSIEKGSKLSCESLHTDETDCDEEIDEEEEFGEVRLLENMSKSFMLQLHLNFLVLAFV